MTIKHFEIDGQNFAAVAAQSGITKSLSPDLPDPRMAVLTKVRMNWKSSEEISPLNELLLARQEQNEEIDRLFQKWRADIRVNLEEDYERAKAACLEQLQRISEAEGEIEKFQNRINDLGQTLFNREAALTTALERKNSLSPYSSKSAIQQTEKNVAAAEAGLEEVQTRVASLEDYKRGIVLETLPKLKQELLRLTSQERAAASAITGEPFHDESGLILPPGTTF
jgi:hypothetical protein